MMDISEVFLCASMKNIPVKPSIWMVHLKWTAILEWTTTIFEHSTSAWQFHHFPSDLARRGWCLLLIGEHIVSPLYNQWITKNPPEYFNNVMYQSTCQCIMYLIMSSSYFCCLFPIWKFWSLSYIDFCFPFYNLLSIFIVVYLSLPSGDFFPSS